MTMPTKPPFKYYTGGAEALGDPGDETNGGADPAFKQCLPLVGHRSIKSIEAERPAAKKVGPASHRTCIRGVTRGRITLPHQKAGVVGGSLHYNSRLLL